MNKTTRRTFIACALALLLAPLAATRAADFHVDPSGNDANHAPGAEQAGG